jgi:RHS repeat-associated protein
MKSDEGSASPQLALPQGGGALRGLGETFSPDLHSGTGNFSVPISLPPGRNGLQPKIELIYSSGNGSSCFGLGWGLDIPGVTRKASKGIPRYVGESDTFLLSGSEDLVQVDVKSGVTTFKPRTEDLFARIQHFQTSVSDHWIVSSKDGLVSQYGTVGRLGDDPASLVNPLNGRQIFAWKLSETRDSFGNRVEYQYDHDAIDEDGHLANQLYLSKIRYGQYESHDGTEFISEVNFFHEDRPDPFSEYRSGFEIRTRKRCKRIEVRTNAQTQRLVRVYRFVYNDELGMPAERQPLNAVSLLSQIIVEGHDGAEVETLPPLEFNYSAFEPSRQQFVDFSADRGFLPPKSLADPQFELVDLFGNGLPDVVQVDGQVRYWRNLGNGKFDFPRTMDSSPPAFRLDDPGVQFVDANGNGRTDLMILDGIRDGYYPLTCSGSWNNQGFVPYLKSPSINLDAPDTKLLDLNGDGVTDALRTGVNFEMFYNDPVLGWHSMEVRQRQKSDEFPDVSFADPRIRLADMTGSGLQDIVKIGSHSMEYWPNLGYGNWGRRISMRRAPQFPEADFSPGIGFDPKRLLFGDIDGDGLADLIYVSSGFITVWINQSGNGWSDPITVTGTPPVTDATSVRLADMLGVGTDGILWTYDFGTFRDGTYKFLDLTGGVKPYVLDQMDNHLGAVTRVAYAPSTQYYLGDQERPETRWRAPLPFPVQVVSKVQVIDQISRSKLTTEFRYHDGYWDGVEREFRGFAFVEQLDTQDFPSHEAVGLHGLDFEFDSVSARHFSAPILTKTWFHQGPVGEENGDWREMDNSAAFFQQDPAALSHVGTIDAFLSGLTEPRAKRDALRTLRGSVLRTEIYALDGKESETRPYTVTESAYAIREESPPELDGSGRPRIFFPHLVAQRKTQWERGNEPMTQFTFSDGYDQFGEPGTQIAIAVPRGRDFKMPSNEGSEPYLATQAVSTFANRTDETVYLASRVTSSKTHEIVNDGRQSIFEFYADVLAGRAPLKLIAESYSYFDGEAFVGLPFGKLGGHGVPTRSEVLVLTPELIAEHYGTQFPPYLSPTGPIVWTDDYPAAFRDTAPSLAGYVVADGSDHRSKGFYVQTRRVGFDFQLPSSTLPVPVKALGLPLVFRDPLGVDTVVSYDRFQMFVAKVTDVAGMATQAEYDYRAMKPNRVIDPNGNISSVRFSPLGLPLDLFVQGKDGSNEGDLQRASVHYEYDFQAFVRSGQPMSVSATRFEHHDSEIDVTSPDRDATIVAIEFSDGFGRVVQTRTQAEDVLFDDTTLATDQDSPNTADIMTGRRFAADSPSSVVVSGWQMYDNKGRVVEKFEPFFSTSFDYAPPIEGQLGQKVEMYYDPLGRLVRTVNPDRSEQLTIFGIPRALSAPDEFLPTPWEAYAYDANDNGGRTHGDAAKSFQHHWNTPTSRIIDPLGRTISSTARNRVDPTEPDAPIQELTTSTSYDIRGNPLSVIDALGRTAFRYGYDMANNALVRESIDAGVRTIVLDASGKEIERRDSKGALTLQAYDRLRRPTHLWARDDASSNATLRQVLQYGDDPATNWVDQRSANRLGKPHRVYDEAGRTTIHAYDFKGNVIDKTREVIDDVELKSVFDTGKLAYQVDWQPVQDQSLEARAIQILDSRMYRTSTSFDALGRTKELHFPLDVEGERKILRPLYNRAGALERVMLGDRPYVSYLAYNAKGQRILLARGNGVLTRYAYDPQTFQLARLRSERFISPVDIAFKPSGGLLQDFGYAYDLAGNILRITDRVPGCGVQDNESALLDPLLANLIAGGDVLVRRFTYDAIYQLRSATGRESKSRSAEAAWMDFSGRAGFNSAIQGVANQDNAPALTSIYRETYDYDAAGNITRMRRGRADQGFVRQMVTAGINNQLSTVTVSGDVTRYEYDANGNMVAENSTRRFHWSHADHMKAFRRLGGASGQVSLHTLYLYDGTGMRVKKLVRKASGEIQSTTYVDGLFEHCRSDSVENNSLQVMDGTQRVALVRVGPAHPDDRGPNVQHHLGDHLGTSAVVIDAEGSFVNREEFMPYGETSFGGYARKRFRFTGMERDEETGLGYHAARYYAHWLGRWCSCDPLGAGIASNLYIYSDNTPQRLTDPGGKKSQTPSNLGTQPSTKGNEGGSSNAESSAVLEPDQVDEGDHGDAIASGSNQVSTCDVNCIDWQESSQKEYRKSVENSIYNVIPPSTKGRQKRIAKPPVNDPNDNSNFKFWDLEIKLGECEHQFDLNSPEFSCGPKIKFVFQPTVKGPLISPNGGSDVSVDLIVRLWGVYAEAGATIDQSGAELEAKAGLSLGSLAVEAKYCAAFICFEAGAEAGVKAEWGVNIKMGNKAKAKIALPIFSFSAGISIDPNKLSKFNADAKPVMNLLINGADSIQPEGRMTGQFDRNGSRNSSFHF